MVIIYGVPQCQKTRKTKTLLEEHGIEYKFVNVKKQPINREELKKIVDQLGLQNVLNSKGPTFRKLGLKERNLDEEELFKWLLKEQGMINRPLIKNGDRYWVGFDEQGILNFIK
jgi:Spx/MgsR family transcriptional regulator